MQNHSCECLVTFGAVLERLGSISLPLEASWPHLVTLLGLSGDVLGRTTRLWCVSKGVLGRLLGVLTSSKARLGRVLRRLVSSQGSPRDAMSENDQNARLLLIDFGSKSIPKKLGKSIMKNKRQHHNTTVLCRLDKTLNDLRRQGKARQE